MKIACPTPKEHCTGGLTEVNANLIGHGEKRKLHTSSEEAFKCHARYLRDILGYKQVGSREFDTGTTIKVLTKKCRFGARMRNGKSADGKSKNRSMPRSGRKHCSNGIIM